MNADKKIGLDTEIVRTNGMEAADMDGEKVMMNIEKGKYYALNSVGSRIWEMICRPQSVSDVVLKLLEEYDVDVETCRDNVVAFLNGMYEEELICICRENV